MSELNGIAGLSVSVRKLFGEKLVGEKNTQIGFGVRIVVPDILFLNR